MAAVIAADVARRFPNKGALPRRNPAARSGAAMIAAPRIATAMPVACFRLGASLSAIAEIAATTAGCRFTSVTEAAIVVRWMDAFHAQKWRPSETPPAI